MRGKNLEARLLPVTDKRFVALLRELEGEGIRRHGKGAAAACRYPGQEQVITACVMLRDNQPVACAAVYRQGDDHAVVSGLYVKPELRGNGLGRDVLDTLELQALWQGYMTLGIRVHPGMKECRALCKKLGFTNASPWDCAEKSLLYLKKDIE